MEIGKDRWWSCGDLSPSTCLKCRERAEAEVVVLRQQIASMTQKLRDMQDALDDQLGVRVNLKLKLRNAYSIILEYGSISENRRGQVEEIARLLKR